MWLGLSVCQPKMQKSEWNKIGWPCPPTVLSLPTRKRLLFGRVFGLVIVIITSYSLSHYQVTLISIAHHSPCSIFTSCAFSCFADSKRVAAIASELTIKPVKEREDLVIKCPHHWFKKVCEQWFRIQAQNHFTLWWDGWWSTGQDFSLIACQRWVIIWMFSINLAKKDYKSLLRG